MNFISSIDVSKSLKRIAADPQYRNTFKKSKTIHELLWPAAHRYIISETNKDLLIYLNKLKTIGYNTGIEYAGEEATSLAEVDEIVSEYMSIINSIMKSDKLQPQIGFDLSNIGSGFSKELAISNCEKICAKAKEKNITIMLSMERSKWTDLILEVFFHVRKKYDNLGLTLQVQLHRTCQDIESVIETGCKIRLVKGVYDEPLEISLARGKELDERYLLLLKKVADNGNEFAYATQDPQLVEYIRVTGLAELGEHEMLHGVRSDLIRTSKEIAKITPRIACVYGKNWFLHLLHRIAEYPRNIDHAVIDLTSYSAPDHGYHHSY